jgi:hypothetical protein
MATEFEITVELLLVILTITCILQVVFMGLLLRYMRQAMESLGSARAGVLPSPAAGAGSAPSPKAAATKAPAEVPKRPASAAPVATAEPVAPAVDLIGGSPDLQGSILRLCEKYDLADFIITTLDGLLVVSLFPGSSEEAARFSDLYRRKKKPDTQGVTFLEMDHQGEAMLCIAKSDRPIPPDQLRVIGEDARKILHWWL